MAEKSDSQKMLISTVEKSDSFVVDLESFDFDRESPENSRITRSISRKGSQKQPNCSNTAIKMDRDRDRDRDRGRVSKVPMWLTAAGTMDHAVISAQTQHHITLTAASIETTSSPANNAGRVLKKSGYRSRRSRFYWALDPRKVFLFFATLSSMGTILLIYFTLSVG